VWGLEAPGYECHSSLFSVVVKKAQSLTSTTFMLLARAFSNLRQLKFVPSFVSVGRRFSHGKRFQAFSCSFIFTESYDRSDDV
jgi:hypothetical protein